MDTTEGLKSRADEAVFIKETEKPVAMDSRQKAALNRKGNALINGGDVEGARRVFLTTGYSDGLSRVGDIYKKEGRLLDALKMYELAHDKRRADEVISKAAFVVHDLLTN
jgi:hypothetical protein